MAMLDMLIQLRKRYGRVRYTYAVRQMYDHVMSVGKVEQYYGHVIQGVSRLQDITAGGDFLGLCGEKSSYKHVSDFGRLRSYGRFLIPVHAVV